MLVIVLLITCASKVANAKNTRAGIQDFVNISITPVNTPHDSIKNIPNTAKRAITITVIKVAVAIFAL